MKKSSQMFYKTTLKQHKCYHAIKKNDKTHGFQMENIFFVMLDH